MSLTVEALDDPRRTRDTCQAFLLQDPVAHNVALTILEDRLAAPVDGRWWVVRDGAAIVGFAFRSPVDFTLGLVPMATPVVRALAEHIAAEMPDVRFVHGDAATTAVFAGHWAEVLAVPGRPVEAERIYRLDALTSVPKAPGCALAARPDDQSLVVDWMVAFRDETDAGPPPSLDEIDAVVRMRIGQGNLHLWAAGDEPVAVAGAHAPAGGVVRVGPVFTPPRHRGRGYASVLVAELSRRALDDGADTCMLYTQLVNPVSNRIYRRMGYEPVGELLRYRLGA